MPTFSSVIIVVRKKALVRMPKLNLETLTRERLVKSVDSELFALGENLYEDGRVQVTELTADSAFCVVQDKHPYRIEIRVAKSFLYLKCDCRYAFRGLICEHDIAACLAVRDILQQRLPPTWRHQINTVIDASLQSAPKKPPLRFLLFFSLQETETYGYSTWKIIPYQISGSVLARFHVDLEESYDELKLKGLLEEIPQLITSVKTPYQMLNPESCINCSPQSVSFANLLMERSRIYNFYGTSNPLNEYLSIIATTQSPLYIGNQQNPIQTPINIFIEGADLSLRLDRNDRGIRIQSHIRVNKKLIDIYIGKEGQLQIINASPLWILIEDYLIKLAEATQIDLIRAFLASPEINIPTRDEGLFQQKYFLSLAEKFNLEGDLVEWQTIESEPVKRVYLSEAESGVMAELRFGYGDAEVFYDPKIPDETILQKPDSWTLQRIKRQIEFEKETFEDLASAAYGLKRMPNAPKPGLLNLRARIHPVDFLLHSVRRLAANSFEVYGEEKLTTARVNRNTPTISFQIASGIDWFDVKAIVNFGELELSLKEFRRALRKKERFIKLPDGTIGVIPEEWREEYKHLFALGEETEEGIRLAHHHVSLIDHALASAEKSNFDLAYSQYRDRLMNFFGIEPVDLPVHFIGDLRPYQKAGYDWLHFLHQYNFGGCLADDMGLGKTVQALVFFQSLKEQIEAQAGKTIPSGENSRPASSGTILIIVPRSLLVNWQREAARFTPKLRILEYFEADRPKEPLIFDQYDIVITTYGVMLRDITILQKFNFHYILLDESQAIKNPISQTARSARLLKSHHRLVLTGTPVENSTQELWSQFAFLNPGLLGNFEYFKTEFMLPIEKKSDEGTTQILRRMIYPFILRRTKDQVAPELPPRTERILYCDMEPAQRKLYNRTRDYYRGLVLGMLEKEGINNARFRILEGLLRLRQISNHPRLVDDKFHGESGKFEFLLETIETLQAEGHKALIFSQFVQMLRLVREPMDDQNIPYVYLDGHTRNRMELVDTYQNNPYIPFFLISLKAGGQGLNLTAADYVIHIDPWWNPAVEMQASDRTHRIGQEKPVFIFKLITRDSVEEKILQLQEKKRRLVDQLITTESGFLKSLTSEDIQDLFS